MRRMFVVVDGSAAAFYLKFERKCFYGTGYHHRFYPMENGSLDRLPAKASIQSERLEYCKRIPVERCRKRKGADSLLLSAL